MKNILVVGGTQGIGHATALKLSKSAKVTAVGRKTLDVSNTLQCKSFASSYAGVPLDAVILTAGNFNIGTRRETSQGIESTFALNYLSKDVLIKSLIPSLVLAKDPTVVCVLSGGSNSINVNPKDLQLKNGYNFFKAAIQSGVLVDFMTLSFAAKFPMIRFVHLFPGIVNTNNPTNAGLPTFITYPLKFIMPLIARAPETVADEIIQICNGELNKHGNALLVHPGLKVVTPPKALLNDALREDIWNETEKILQGLEK